MKWHFLGLIVAIFTFSISATSSMIWAIYSYPVEVCFQLEQTLPELKEVEQSGVNDEAVGCGCHRHYPVDPRPLRVGVMNTKAISKPRPPYPVLKLAAPPPSGEVAVQIVVDEQGKVIWACAISGHALLRPAAEQAASQARFIPAQLSGQPVHVEGIIIYRFVLR